MLEAFGELSSSCWRQSTTTNRKRRTEHGNVPGQFANFCWWNAGRVGARRDALGAAPIRRDFLIVVVQRCRRRCVFRTRQCASATKFAAMTVTMQ